MRAGVRRKLAGRGLAILAIAVVFTLFFLPAAVSAWKGPGNPLEPIEQEVVDLVNEEREARGVPTLVVNYSLQEAAWRHTEHMAAKRVMCHSGCGDGDPAQRIAATGYKAATWGENVASGQRSSTQVMNAWMNSSGHRANILNPAFTDIGVAFAPAGLYGTSWTQVFGRPKEGYPTVTPPVDPGEDPPACENTLDVTGDCKVTSDDVAAVKDHFMTRPGHPNWDAKYDVVENEVVNVYDVFAVVLGMAEGD